MSKVNLKDLLPEEVEGFFEGIGEKKFRGRQAVKWMYTRYEADFSRFSDYSKALRTKAAERAEIPELPLLEHQISKETTTEKFLFQLPDGQAVEAVLMKFEEHLGFERATACISTQVGCAMDCKFCASGQAGLLRNLKTWEIVDQVLQIQKRIAERGERVANIVFMGIGEPLANYTNVLRAIKILNHEEGLQIGMRHIAVSTCGLVPQIRKLAQEKLPLRLAISLHGPTDEVRNKTMPINRKYPVAELIEACREYQQVTERRLTFEYILIEDVNDAPEHAHQLGQVLRGLHSLVNLIPINPVEGYPGKRPPMSVVREFQRIVETYGIKTTVRQEMGTDIDAACGQLRRNHAARQQPLAEGTRISA
ncbi:MAG: 23S rRNA (adenine(2503)-C(2))-methyltransferase RlmN [Candidatus Xenobia bacterium]